ncbi:MAG: hypothetical protein V3V08_10255 [Nannocystaceae bacterium]
MSGTPTQLTEELTRAHSARDQHGHRDFRLVAHLTQTLSVAAVVAALGAALTLEAAPQTWCFLPLFWLIANFVEWGVHKHLMHKPRIPKVMYRNHALWHHTAFQQNTLAVRHTWEFSLVMMPWYTLVFVFVFASPIAIAAAVAGGPELAGVFLVASVAYFLAYELLHTLYHVDPKSIPLRRTLIGRLLLKLRAHHAHHHRLDRMAVANFNVTVGLADWVLGTSETSETSETADTDGTSA